MKKILLLFSLTCVFLIQKNYAQQQNLIGSSFITIADFIEVNGVDAYGNIDLSKTFKIRVGTKFRINGFDDNNNLKITFWDYYINKDNTHAVKANQNNLKATNTYPVKDTFIINSWANRIEFVIDPKLLDNSCKQYFGKSNTFTWGFMTLPIKVRFGDKKNRLFTFEENLSLGLTCGYRYQFPSKNPQAINVLSGFGIGRSKIDTSSMKNTILTPSSNTAPTLNLNLGILYQFEVFQVGFFIGGDYILTEIGRNWKYQGKPWLGMAIGVSLFSKNNTNTQDGLNR